MEDINLKNETIDFMGKKKYSSRSRGTLWPSEASVEYVNSFGETTVLGKCKRAVWYRRKGFGESDPPGPKSQLIFMLGNLIENQLIEIWKRMGMYEANSVRWENKAYNLSGEIDSVLNYKGRLFSVECLHPKTLITLDTGWGVPIAEIIPGESILDKNGERVKVKSVQRRSSTPGEYGVKIYSDINPGGTIFSENHKIWIEDKFIEAGKVEKGMCLSVPKRNESDVSLMGESIDLWEEVPRIKDYFSLSGNFLRTSVKEAEGKVVKKKINRNLQMDEAMFRYMGVLTAMGTTGHTVSSGITTVNTSKKIYKVFSHSENAELNNQLIKLGEDYFNAEVKTKEHDDGRVEIHTKSWVLILLMLHFELTKPPTVNMTAEAFFINPHLLDDKRLKAFMEGFIGQNLDYRLEKKGAFLVHAKILPRVVLAMTRMGIPVELKKDKEEFTQIHEVHWGHLPLKEDSSFLFYPITKIEKVLPPSIWYNLETTGSATYLANLFGISNCKSFYGYHANKEILGHSEGRGANRVFVPGKPKNEHLMQAAIYAYETRESLEGCKLFYCSRDNNDMAEFNIKVDVEGSIFIDGVMEQRFKMADIYNRFSYIDRLIETSNLPPEKDYIWKPSDERIKTLFERGEISKSAYKEHTEGKEKYTQWQCDYCSYRKLCQNVET